MRIKEQIYNKWNKWNKTKERKIINGKKAKDEKFRAIKRDEKRNGGKVEGEKGNEAEDGNKRQ